MHIPISKFLFSPVKEDEAQESSKKRPKKTQEKSDSFQQAFTKDHKPTKGLNSIRSTASSLNSLDLFAEHDFVSKIPEDRLKSTPALKHLKVSSKNGKRILSLDTNVEGIDEKSYSLKDKKFKGVFEKIFAGTNLDLDQKKTYYESTLFHPESKLGGFVMHNMIIINKRSSERFPGQDDLVLANEATHQAYHDLKYSFLDKEQRFTGLVGQITKLKIETSMDEVYKDFETGIDFGNPLTDNQANEFLSDAASINVASKDFERILSHSSGRQPKNPINKIDEGYHYTLAFMRQNVSDILKEKGFTDHEIDDFFERVKDRELESEHVYDEFCFDDHDVKRIQDAYMLEATRIIAHFKESLPKHIETNIKESNELIENPVK